LQRLYSSGRAFQPWKTGVALAAEGVGESQTAWPAGTYFVTSTSWQSGALILKPKAAELLVGTMLHYRDNQAYRLHAFVLIPEHFHFLVTPCAELSARRAAQLVKGGSAHTIREELGLAFPV